MSNIVSAVDPTVLTSMRSWDLHCTYFLSISRWPSTAWTGVGCPMPKRHSKELIDIFWTTYVGTRCQNREIQTGVRSSCIFPPIWFLLVINEVLRATLPGWCEALQWTMTHLTCLGKTPGLRLWHFSLNVSWSMSKWLRIWESSQVDLSETSEYFYRLNYLK